MGRKVSTSPRHEGAPKRTRQGPEPAPRGFTRGEVVPTTRLGASANAPRLDREVKIAITEGLGTFWLAPRLIEFQRANPHIVVNLDCDMRLPDVRGLSTGVAVQLTKPTDLDLAIVRLGRLHSMPFVAQPYVEHHGVPRSVEEMRDHRLVLQCAEQTSTQQLYDLVFPDVPQPGFVAMRTTTSSAHYWAIAEGAGIGWLPTYAGAIGARVVPIDVDLRFAFDIWLTYRPGANRDPRTRKTIDWIITSFDGHRFPWFGDAFIHPNDLAKAYRGSPLVNLFEGVGSTPDSADGA